MAAQNVTPIIPFIRERAKYFIFNIYPKKTAAMQESSPEPFKRPDLSVYPVRKAGDTASLLGAYTPIPHDLDPTPFPYEVPLCS